MGWTDRLKRIATMPVLGTAPKPEAKSGTWASQSFPVIPGQAGPFRPLAVTGDLPEITKHYAIAYAVYIGSAIRYRAQKVAEPALWYAQEDKDGNEEWLRDTPMQQLLDYPSEDYDMGELLEITSGMLDLTGQALWLKSETVGGRVGALYPVSGDEFTVEMKDGRVFGQYKVSSAVLPQVNGRPLDPSEVIHFRYPNPIWRGKATAPADLALRWAGLGKELEDQIKGILQNALIPPAIVTYPPDEDPDKEQIEKNRDEFRRKYQGSGVTGDPVFTFGGVTVQMLTQDMSRILPSELLDRVEANVALAFQVRPEVLGYMVGLKNSPWSHMPEARKITYQDAIIPTWRRMEKALTRQLLTDADRRARRFVRFDTSSIASLRDDEMEKAQIAKLNERIWTVGEARAYTGKDPFGDDRDNAMVADTGSGGLASAFDQMSAVVTLEAKSERKDLSQEPARTLYWFEQDAEWKAQEATWTPEVTRALAAQSKAIRDLAAKHLRMDGDVLDPDSVSTFLEASSRYLDTEGRETLRRTVEPLLKATTERAGRRVAARFGFNFQTVVPGLTRYAEFETAFLVEKMGETTGKAVADAISKALEDRLPLRDLAKRLEELSEFDRTRAQLVARTETTRATNGAQRRAMKDHADQTGKVVEKTWISSRDARVREEHAAQDNGEWYAIDANFPDVGMESPGEPNCRCTLGYRVRQEGDNGDD